MSIKHNANAEAVIKRVSRKNEEDEHGSAWKVAFADFCLALMCLFLVLWVMAARDKEELQENLNIVGGGLIDEGQGHMTETVGGPTGSLIPRDPVVARENAILEAGMGKRVIKNRYESAEELQDLARALALLSEQAGLAGNLQTIVTPYGLRVMLHDTDRVGMFVRGSAVPSERFRQLLRRMGPVFALMENQMLIVGHTDSVQFAADRQGPLFSNWTLSSQRAMAARTELLAGGMPAEGVLQEVGMADRAPLDVERPAAGVNRRIELLILTSGQAQAVAAMFGMPRETVPLMEGVDSALPDDKTLSLLRNKLRAQKVSLTNTH
ncbi:MAG: motB [Rhodocyclaceae bacterium]|nr:motB [Rhodocyclaceae bacterium]